MEKAAAVASLGQAPLLQPARVRAALQANDRLKLCLTVLQAAAAQARQPGGPALDLGREIAAAAPGDAALADWLHELPATAAMQGGQVQLPDLPRLARHLQDDLAVMARPLLDDAATPPALAGRVPQWQAALAQIQGPRLDDALLRRLTHGHRGHAGEAADDSLHLLVMDLHKALNQLAARLATGSIDGAHVWQLAEDGADAPRVAAFMRGLRRTAPLKLDHPGLDTSATRDGGRLLIQNDIGTNDAHVLVLQVDTAAATPSIALTYSDLHRQRFAFFQALLSEVGAQWRDVHSQTTAGLNAGEAYHLGTALFACADEAALQAALEGIGARIVFLIDWNRARKRLLAFVDKPGALAVLREGARRECGHMAWLQAGGERLVWDAMAAQAQGPGGSPFRLGDRLDAVMGPEAAQGLLTELLQLAWQAAQRRQPAALVADEARWLLARRLQGRAGEHALLEEHAALCHALAQALRDGLAHGVHRDAAAAGRLAARAKQWERDADHLVMRARSQVEQGGAGAAAWQPALQLLAQADDVADALEEAAFVLALVADGHAEDWNAAVLAALQPLADAVLVATQDQVRALAVARCLADGGDASDQQDFLGALWRVLQAERQCDTLLRNARRTLARELKGAAALQLANELAAALEQATDALLALVYRLRDRSFAQAGAGSGTPGAVDAPLLSSHPASPVVWGANA